eukprot:NODE_7636_length_757_cov_31.020505_g7022_i0.p1 GENE.NODE_7636_length_757_cov_31.020505_g7022_i0~~NODE_7636_length_757_cov_31.020505_g7022_i0.p1  ORF type:complete len:184 (+),score=49.92 NODE_7636_length_757_cov_31.020505_g7022_i0:43-552(+)
MKKNIMDRYRPESSQLLRKDEENFISILSTSLNIDLELALHSSLQNPSIFVSRLHRFLDRAKVKVEELRGHVIDLSKLRHNLSVSYGWPKLDTDEETLQDMLKSVKAFMERWSVSRMCMEEIHARAASRNRRQSESESSRPSTSRTRNGSVMLEKALSSQTLIDDERWT